MRYRFFTGCRIATAVLTAVLLATAVQSALRLSVLASAYGALREENHILTQRLFARQQQVAELAELERTLDDPDALLALGYAMGLVCPGDLVFFDGG